MRRVSADRGGPWWTAAAFAASEQGGALVSLPTVASTSRNILAAVIWSGEAKRKESQKVLRQHCRPARAPGRC